MQGILIYFILVLYFTPEIVSLNHLKTKRKSVIFERKRNLRKKIMGGGQNPNFKHDYEGNPRGDRGGGSSYFSKKIMGDEGGQLACNPPPITYKMEQP